MPMSLPILLRGEQTVVQLDMLMRADRLLPGGRYYAGSLTAEQVAQLTERLHLRAHDESHTK